jgi:hypothetical protein
MVKAAYLAIAFAVLTMGSVLVGTTALNDYFKTHVATVCDDDSIVENSFIWLPEKVSDLFYGNRVNLVFTMFDGNEFKVNGVVARGKITGLRCGMDDGRDFDVRMSDVTAVSLATSTRPVRDFVTMWRTDRITVMGQGDEKGRKLAYAEQLMAQDDEPVPERIRGFFSRFIED